jgi:phosphoglycolate phosphatase-like HAD superfamily hydrolase
MATLPAAPLMSDPQLLRDLKPTREFFIGIDSDGCVFDTMELKHRKCFAPAFIKHFQLEAVSNYAREVWDFVNLYSKFRGTNRFPALVRALNLLRQHPEVIARNVSVPDTSALESWIARETRLGNAALQREIDAGNRSLAPALAWSLAVNQAVADIVSGIPPFPHFRECLQKMVQRADVIVVSQTPTEALVREWREHGIDRYVRAIAGQESGTKADHLRFAAAGKYRKDGILMIGDAPGDLEAARRNDALFYPIIPGSEEASWDRLWQGGLDRFFSGAYKGDYETGLVAEFDASLPEAPPWDHRT